MLEVGGGPGPLESFLPDYELFVSDISGAPHERFLLADGSKLPFADDTFAVAVTLDVLEHVPPQIRAPFLAELLRVSSDLVVLSAPFAHPDLELAEEALNEFIRARFQGDFPTLDEHADNGLPELGATVDGARRHRSGPPRRCRAGTCRTGSSGMLVHHELLATGLPHLGKLHAYYNQVVSPYDCREPSYRHVIVAAHDRPADEVDRVVGPLRAPETPGAGQAALNAIAGAILAQRLNAVARTEVLGRELDEIARPGRGPRCARSPTATRTSSSSSAASRTCHQEKEDLKDEAQRRWLLGVPYAARPRAPQAHAPQGDAPRVSSTASPDGCRSSSSTTGVPRTRSRASTASATSTTPSSR